jgi:hypothetical protein
MFLLRRSWSVATNTSTDLSVANVLDQILEAPDRCAFASLAIASHWQEQLLNPAV